MNDQTEPDDYEPEEEVVTEEPQDISSYFTTPFTEERLQNVHRLRSTPWKEEAKYELDHTTLYPRGKKGLHALIDQFLSERTNELTLSRPFGLIYRIRIFVSCI